MENEKEENKAKTTPGHEPSQEMPLLDEPILVSDFLHMMIASLEGKAWAYLGKISHPETKKQKTDTEQARMAIDAIDAIHKIVEKTLSPEEKKDLQIRLTNLRLNFAK